MDLAFVEPEQLPEPLAEELARIVSAEAGDLRLNPSALLAADALIDAQRRYYPVLRERLRVEGQLQRVRRLDFGGTPHTNVVLPADSQVRHRAAIFARIARPGWLTSSWLVAVAIGYGMVISRLEMNVLFSASPGLAGTAAALLPLLPCPRHIRL